MRRKIFDLIVFVVAIIGVIFILSVVGMADYSVDMHIQYSTIEIIKKLFIGLLFIIPACIRWRVR